MIGGIIVGGLVNYGVVIISGSIIPLPEGIDPKDMESMKNGMHLYQPKHFLMPILAHALGTLVGAFVVAKLAVSHHMRLAYGIGVFFLLGGIIAVLMIGAPAWVNVTDLMLAYLPMAYIGGKLGAPKTS